MKNITIRFGAMAMLSLAILAGCQKSGNEEVSTAEQTEMNELSADDSEAAGTYNDVFEMVAGVDAELGFGDSPIFGGANDGGDDGEIVPGNPPDPNRCVVITVTPRDPGVFPKTVVMDFGSGCTGPDGRTRKGKIITTYTNRLAVPGAEATTRFDGYYVNGNHVQGVHITKNESSSAVRIITRVVREAKITRPNGDYIKWAGKHTNTQIEGLGTPAFQRDDVHSITGGAEGERKVGDKIVKWSRVIVSPVIKAAACKWPSKGEIRITRNDLKALLNYGDGTCDDKATVTVNGNTKEITLR